MTQGAGNTVSPPRPCVAVVSTRTAEVDAADLLSLEEHIFAVTHQVLADAGLTRDALDAVVISANDQTDGRVISCMVAAGPVGGVDHDVTMIASSGDHALIYGYLRLLAGQGSNVLVVGWGKPSESLAPDHAELVSAEPMLLRPIGMNHTIAAGLQASRLGAQPSAEGAMASWPVSRQDLPARGDVVQAAVLAVEGTFPTGAELAWITGAGWAMGGYEMGARDLADLSLLNSAVTRAVRVGGPSPGEWDVVEVAAPSEPMVRHAVSSLQLDPGAEVNPSGGLAERQSTPQVAGLGRMIAAIDSVGAASGPANAAGIGMQGFASQGVAVMTFSNRKVAA